MNKEIFRRAALDRLASPEQLDRPVKIVSPIGWTALAGFLLAVLVALIWGYSAHAPVKVLGQGILIQQGGLLEIVSNKQGHLQELKLRPGMEIKEGETVAIFSQSELERELISAKASFTDAVARRRDLKTFYEETKKREDAGERERLETIAQVKKQVSKRLELLEEKAKNLKTLARKKFVRGDTLIDSQLNIANARERLSKLEDEEITIALKRVDRNSKRKLVLLDEELKVKELERKVARLEAQLKEKKTLISPHSGIVVEVKTEFGDVVVPGKSLATLAPRRRPDSSLLTAVFYVPPKDGKRVKPGMKVEIIPSTIRPEKFGYMLGKVETVSSLPATIDGMKIVLKNEQLARQLSGDGAPFEVRVRPITDPSTPSGFKWSSSKGPSIKINAGTLTEGKLIVDRVRLIGLLVPGLDRIGDVYDGE